jgi:hypothetical protein
MGLARTRISSSSDHHKVIFITTFTARLSIYANHTHIVVAQPQAILDPDLIDVLNEFSTPTQRDINNMHKLTPDQKRSVLNRYGKPSSKTNEFFEVFLTASHYRRFIEEANRAEDGPAHDEASPEFAQMVDDYMDALEVIARPQGAMLPIVNQPALYVREEYKRIYNDVITKTPDNTVLFKGNIFGTAGIGKSCFLVYIAIRRLVQDNFVVFQTIDDCYCFTNKAARIGDSTSFKPYLTVSSTWYLVDGNATIFRVKAKSLVAISPKRRLLSRTKS